MKIALINGSPKRGDSTSGFLLNQLETCLGKGHDVFHYTVGKKPFTHDDYDMLCHMDVLVFSFPLYIDAIPSHLFRMMVQLEESFTQLHKSNRTLKDIYVYAIINNGFFEGKQTWVALDIVKNWSIRAGLHYGQGIGAGAGEMISNMNQIPLGHGPLKNLGNAIRTLADNIAHCNHDANQLINPNFPRPAWRFAATHTFWHPAAKKNGLNIRDLQQQP